MQRFSGGVGDCGNIPVALCRFYLQHAGILPFVEIHLLEKFHYLHLSSIFFWIHFRIVILCKWVSSKAVVARFGGFQGCYFANIITKTNKISGSFLFRTNRGNTLNDAQFYVWYFRTHTLILFANHYNVNWVHYRCFFFFLSNHLYFYSTLYHTDCLTLSH